MSDSSVTERRLRPILDAIANRNWKQALQQCDKWQKKGEKSDRFLALRSSILINQPDKVQVDRGKAELLQLCHRNPAVIDVQAICQLQDSLKQLSLQQEEGSKLWERAIATRPNDKDLLTVMLNGSISDGDWRSAQKAAMALRKAFPKERQYDFWNILLCYLIHQDTSLPQKDRDLFGRLAFMLMSKAADAVPKDTTEVLTSGKEVSTPEELALLVKIYNATGHADQAVKALMSSTLGLESRVAGMDPQFVFSLLLEALAAIENKDEAFQICKDFIVSGSTISKGHFEDDRIWNIITTSSANSGTTSSLNIRLDLADSIIRKEPKCRAAYLAYFDLWTSQIAIEGSADGARITSVCRTYYDNFKTKPFCYSDLIKVLCLDKPAINSFLRRSEAEHFDDLQQSLILKLRYFFLEAEPESSSESTYLELAKDAVHLHKLLPKQKSECPEMLLLAASTLLRLSLKLKNNNYAVQASYILQICDENFNEYYPTTIRKLQLHLINGQISMAMERFTSLAIKNIQWETVGYLLLTRISTLHPWAASDASEATNPLAALDAGLNMLHNADRSLEKAIEEGLKFGSYSNVIDTIRVRDNVTKSMNRQVFMIEERAAQRVVGVPQDIVLDPFPAGMVDRRDSSFISDFGNFPGRTELEEVLSCGPLPKSSWLIAKAFQDHLVTYLRAELASNTTLSTLSLARLQTIAKKLDMNDTQWSTGLTSSELQSFQQHQMLYQALSLTIDVSSKTTTQASFEKCIEDFQSWLTTLISSSSQDNADDIQVVNGISAPTWKLLHASFVHLEVLQTGSLFVSLQARRTKTIKSGKAVIMAKDSLTALSQAIQDAEKAIQGQAKKAKDSIAEPGVLGKMVDTAAGRVDGYDSTGYKVLSAELADLIDEAALEEWCGRLRESWEDALDGILRVKIRSVK